MNAKNNFSLLRFPKPYRPIPIDSLPGGEYAQRYIEITAAAHADEMRRLKFKLSIAIFAIGIGGLIAFIKYEDLTDRLNAPDQVSKEKAAQRWIIMGPAEVLLKEDYKPGDQVIPPNGGWKNQK